MVYEICYSVPLKKDLGYAIDPVYFVIEADRLNSCYQENVSKGELLFVPVSCALCYAPFKRVMKKYKCYLINLKMTLFRS